MLTRSSQQLNAVPHQTIINKLINYYYGLYKQTFRRKLRLG